MPLSTWIRTVHLHWLSGASHWAEVMARADVFENEHPDDALGAVERQYRCTKSFADRQLLRDIRAELQRRALG